MLKFNFYLTFNQDKYKHTIAAKKRAFFKKSLNMNNREMSLPQKNIRDDDKIVAQLSSGCRGAVSS